MKKNKSSESLEDEDGEKVVYKDKTVLIMAKSKDYSLKFDKNNKGAFDKIGAVSYHYDFEGVLREIMRWSMCDGLKSGYKVQRPTLMDILKTMEKSELRIKEIASKIPMRLVPEGRDVNISAAGYFDRVEEKF